MYLNKLDATGMRLLETLEESGYVLHSPVGSVRLSDLNYPGVYEVIHRDGNQSFMKDSSLITKPFAFPDEETAVKHLNVYSRLSSSDEKFYNKRSFFALQKGDDGYGIVACMPALVVLDTMERTASLVAAFNDKCSAFFSRWPMGLFHDDVAREFNYGLAEDGEIYYLDLHLFESIPSPLVDDARVKKNSTSALSLPGSWGRASRT
jgi:hypothetical protein